MPFEPNPHDKDLLLAAAEGRLGGEEMTVLRAHLEQCPECRADYDGLRLMAEAARHWPDAPVPRWRPETLVPRHERPAFGWPNWLSLGASCAALLLVAFKVEVASTGEGVKVNFGGEAPAVAATPAASDVERLLKDFELRQDAKLERRLAEQEETTRETTRELVRAVAARNRVETREDLDTLLTYWQAQREADKANLERKVNNVSSQQIQNRRVLDELLRSVNVTDSSVESL